MLWAIGPHLTLSADVGTDSNPDPAARVWPRYSQIGAIFSIHPDLTLDLGYQRNHGADPARTWLLGLTYHFSP